MCSHDLAGAEKLGRRRWVDDGRAGNAGRQVCWKERAKEWLRTATDVPFEGASAKSRGLATHQQTRLAPPVFDPCRSGLARSVTIISQLRSKATKQLIPPQHPIDAFWAWGERMGMASPRLPRCFANRLGSPVQRFSQTSCTGQTNFPTWTHWFGHLALQTCSRWNLRFHGRSKLLGAPPETQ